LRRFEFSTSYGKLFVGLSDKSDIDTNFVATVLPFRKLKGTLGVAFNQLKLENLYQESQYIFSYGRKLKIWNLGKVETGLSLKILSHSYGTDDYTYNAIDETGQAQKGVRDPVFLKGNSKNAFSIDIGFKKEIGEGTSVAFVLMNLNSPDVGIKDKDKVPASIKVGISMTGKNGVFAFDLVRRDRDNIIRGGAEFSALKELFLRGGIEIGSRNLVNLNTGFGYVVNNKIFVDYGFIFPASGINRTYGTHKISINVKFGVPEKRIIKSKKLTEEKKKELMRKYFGQATKYYRQEQYEKAIRMWEKVLELDPTHEISKEKIQKAKEMKKLKEKKGKESQIEYHYQRGVEFYLEGDLKKAKEEFNKVLQISPDHPQAKEMLKMCR